LGRLTGEGLVERVGSTMFVAPSSRLFERLGGAEDASLLTMVNGTTSTETAIQ
jgi:hypothetical protein